MFFRQLLNDETACASYLFGCTTHPNFAVVEPHIDLVDEYIARAEAQGAPIVAVLDTHVQADHVSGMAELVARTGARAYLPEGAGVEFDHHPLKDGEVITLGNTQIQAIATPGHAVAHPAYLITDRRRAEEPWLVLSGDALQRRHNLALQFSSEEQFVQSLIRDIPPAPEQQAAIVAANRTGRPLIDSNR